MVIAVMQCLIKAPSGEAVMQCLIKARSGGSSYATVNKGT